jgi:transposase InsO family protein
LTADIIALAKAYGRYGYRRITALLHDAGWVVNVKRVQRIWRRERLKVPEKQPKRGRLFLVMGAQCGRVGGAEVAAQTLTVLRAAAMEPRWTVILLRGPLPRIARETGGP